MITSLIFFIHFLFALIVFTRRWQEDGLSSGFANVALILILFSVGWTLTTLGAQVLMEQEGLGLYFDRDAFSLTLLTIAEFFFYRIYYSDLFSEDDKEKQ